MDIYGSDTSGNCLKIKYTADYLKLDYQWHEVDFLNGATHTDEFLQMNRFAQIPVVRLNNDNGADQWLAQSNAIIRYLAVGSDLLPADPLEQAYIDEWMFWEQYSHEPYVAVCRFQMVYQNVAAEDRDPTRVEKGEAALDVMNDYLQDKQFLANEKFSVADIALLAYTRLAHEGGFDLQSRNALSGWVQRCDELLEI